MSNTIIILLLLSAFSSSCFSETVDCRVYNNLYLCLADSDLQNVAFEDVDAVQTIDDIELHLEDLGLTWISDVAFFDVNNSSALYLRGNRLTIIKRHFFRNLDQLTYLDLKNNWITDIEDGAFSRLINLETLVLEGNRISVFRPGIWKGLSNLHELYAPNNYLVLRRNIFRGLRELETLALDSNNITDIPLGSFDGLRHIDLLYLSRNKISYLHPDVFQGLNEISELDLGENSIRTLPNDAFKSVRSLEKLWLNGNKLESLDFSSFSGLNRLRMLFLNSNYLTSVNFQAFGVMKSGIVEPGFKIDGILVTDFRRLEGRYRCTNRGYQEPYDCVKVESLA